MTEKAIFKKGLNLVRQCVLACKEIKKKFLKKYENKIQVLTTTIIG
jgi:hypothetical protein